MRIMFSDGSDPVVAEVAEFFCDNDDRVCIRTINNEFLVNEDIRKVQFQNMCINLAINGYIEITPHVFQEEGD